MLSRHAGIYKGEKVFEIDNVGVGTKSLSFNDLLEINKFGLVIEMLFNSRIMRELENFVEDYNLSYFDYLMIVYNNIDDSPKGVQEIFHLFNDLRMRELKTDEKELIEYYSIDENFDKVISGEEGGNCKYTAKSLLLSKNIGPWLDYVYKCLEELMIKNDCPIKKDFEDLYKFSQHKLHGILDPQSTKFVIKENFSHDILNWLEDSKRRPLSQYNSSSIDINFFYNDQQIKERDFLFDKFDDMDNIYQMTNFIEGIRPQHRLFRKFQYA